MTPSLSIACMVLSFLLLSVNPAFAQSAFEIKGSCKTVCWNSEGEELQSLEFPFDVKVVRDTWAIRVEDASVQAGRRQSWDYAETVYDGKDLFRVVHYPETVVKTSEAKDAFATYGLVETKSFPDQATPAEKVIWLAFCAGSSPPFDLTNFPPIDISFMPLNLSRVEVEYAGDAPHVAKTAKIWAKGLLLQKASTQSNATQTIRFQVMPLKAPFRDGHLALEFESGQFSSNNGLILPARTVASFYTVDTRMTPAKHYRTAQLTLSVNETLAPPTSLQPPALPGTADVVDMRFTRMTTNKHSHIPFHYLETNGVWASRSDPDMLASLQQKPEAPTHGAPTVKPGADPASILRDKTRIVKIALLLSLLVPLGFLATKYLRRDTAGNTTTTTKPTDAA